MVRPGPVSDVLIAGAGPAGLALAEALAQLGLTVSLAERSLGRAWARSYGTWATGLPPGFAEDAIVGRFARPCVTFANGEQRTIGQKYVRFATNRLQPYLEGRARSAGVRFVHASLERTIDEGSTRLAALREHGGQQLQLRARVIVNCTGRPLTHLPKHSPTPAFQSAFGAWFEVSRQPFAPGEMSLMDLRSAPTAGTDGLSCPSFLYAMPEGPGLLFAQETVLASRRPAPLHVLEARLHARLRELGVDTQHALRSERCLIPLGLPPQASSDPLLAFGAAAGMIQPASGYSLARALTLAPRVAALLAKAICAPERSLHRPVGVGPDAIWSGDARRAWLLHRLGLETLLGWKPGEMDAFWRAFFDLPAQTVARFMDGSLDARGVARALWSVFLRMPSRLRLDLLRGSARFFIAPTANPGSS
jgi:lycopene beta-cyclase